MFGIRHNEGKTSTDTQVAYNDIFRSQGIQLRDSFYLWIISLFNPIPGRILIDISCGQGRLVQLAYNKGLIPIGIDFAIEGVRKAQVVSPNPDWIIGNGECLPLLDNCADYVSHIGSLEHYIFPDLGAKEIARILKPGGIACILLPNAFGLLGNVRNVCKTGEVFDDGQPLQRYATFRQWEILLTDAGLIINKSLGYDEIETPRTNKDFLQMVKRPRKVLRALLASLVPMNLKNHFVFLCTRA